MPNEDGNDEDGCVGVDDGGGDGAVLEVVEAAKTDLRGIAGDEERVCVYANRKSDVLPAGSARHRAGFYVSETGVAAAVVGLDGVS